MEVNSMDQNEYQELKKTGQLVGDADLSNAPTEAVIEEVIEEEVVVDEVIEDEKEIIEKEDDLPELDEKQKTAFDKRLERERNKLEEKLRKEIEEQSEQKYSKHKAAIEAIGGDPDKIIEAAREAAFKREADRIGDNNGWSEEDKQFYIEQEKQKHELKELRVLRQIDKLKNDPDYAGIEGMEKDILAKIDKSGGQLTVDEAYWAIGGPKKAAQIKLEATMREAEKRKTQPRTVLTDNPTTTTGEKPLPADVVRDMERMGITAAEARRLMSTDSPKNIEEWREQRKAK
jgi:hypothetical protein